MLQDWTYIVPYFATTPIYKINADDYILFIGYIFFTAVVALSIMKLIYDMNLKFQIVVHILSFLFELINLALIVFLTI